MNIAQITRIMNVCTVNSMEYMQKYNNNNYLMIIKKTCIDTEELMFTHGFMHTHGFTIPYIADGKQEVCEVSR